MTEDKTETIAEGNSLLPYEECMETHAVEFVGDILWGLGYDKEPEDTLKQLICEILEDHKVKMEITCPKCLEGLESKKEYAQSYYIQSLYDGRNLSMAMREERIAARQKRQAEAALNDDAL